ncbi:DUF2500 domain-containing protein [Brevibacillus laterosporus]|uniref:DUF2500 domain-containing protein n=1 Tax=Brevibacillus laterosporus TaxID=1465 RepID=UPI00264DCA69|nr:DUF2500 domain-containing protein [Brevibacillus laterosporus]MDN9010359.1 DUF2500 domain-containing protein [Brevibacillus laterosporus]MDO0941246.1 DUF2500 domain-containing protein [Brevibacillus laterosporus]
MFFSNPLEPGSPMFDFTFSFMANVIPVIVIGGFIFVIGRALFTWTTNNHSPVENKQAHIVSKRFQVSGGSGNHASHTSYYVTFELLSGERKEFQLTGSQYGLLAEGDHGIVSYQGTRFKGFQRQTTSA